MDVDKQQTLGLYVLQLAKLASVFPLSDYLELESLYKQYDTILPIVQPTFYKENLQEIQDCQKLLQAFIVFRRCVEELQ